MAGLSSQLVADAGVVPAHAGKAPGARADWVSSKRRLRRQRVIGAASGAARSWEENPQ